MSASSPPSSAFSSQLPSLQLALDSTSLGEFKICPRRYYYRMIEGWRPRSLSVDLEFGLLVHAGIEQFHKRRAEGADWRASLIESLRLVLGQTWDARLGRARQLDDPSKNRLSLVRSLVWYFDKYERAEERDPLRVIQLSNGRPAVELSFKFDSGYESSSTKEPFLLCGHLDRLVELNGQPWVCDVKTSRYSLDGRWLQSFSPDNQFSLYVYASQIVWREPVQGLIADGMQVGATFTRFRREPIERTPEQISEWYEDLEYWLNELESNARSGRWPRNDKVCGLYGGCPYREVCGRSPARRQQKLEADFIRETWNPLEAR